MRGGRQKYRRTVGDAAACTTSIVSQKPIELQQVIFTVHCFSKQKHLQIVAKLLQAERKVAPTFKPLQLDVTGGCVNRFAAGVRDRLLNLISWAKNVPGRINHHLLICNNNSRVLRNGSANSNNRLAKWLARRFSTRLCVLLSTVVFPVFEPIQNRQEAFIFVH